MLERERMEFMIDYEIRADEEVDNVELNLKCAREHLVVKESSFVQKARYSLNRLQSVTLMYLISKIQPGDVAGKTYRVDFDEFLSLLRWTDPRYNSVKDALQELACATWWMETANGREQLEGFIEKVRIDPQKRYCNVKFRKSCFPYLYGLRDRATEYTNYRRQQLEEIEGGDAAAFIGEEPDPAYYTAYPIGYVAVMEHRYSPRLYELLKSYLNREHWVFEVGTGSDRDLHQKLATDALDDNGEFIVPKTWSNWAIFKRDVLNKAIDEINNLTDLTVSYTGYKYNWSHRKTKGVETVRFWIRKKSAKELALVNQRIEEKYKTYPEAKKSKRGERLAKRKNKRVMEQNNGISQKCDRTLLEEKSKMQSNDISNKIEEWYTPEDMEVFAEMAAVAETHASVSGTGIDEIDDETHLEILRELAWEKREKEIMEELALLDEEDDEEYCELPY